MCGCEIRRFALKNIVAVDGTMRNSLKMCCAKMVKLVENVNVMIKI